MDDQCRGDGKVDDREHKTQVGAQGRQGRDQEQDDQVPSPHAEVPGGAETDPDPQWQRGEENTMGEKKLGFGCMRVPLLDPSNNTSADMKQLEAMVDRFLAAGFRYFDTAYMYHDFKSETFVREALVKRHNRDSFLVADKLPLGMLKKKEDVDRIFQEQKEKQVFSILTFI